MNVVFITPFYNAGRNFKTLLDSLKCQKNDNWKHVLINDVSTDNSSQIFKDLVGEDGRFQLIENTEKKYALNNIIKAARLFQDSEDTIIAIIDGDDYLCNENTVDLLINTYSEGADISWTAHRWDINGMNISKEIPNHVNPYGWPWSSSHLKTFKSSLLDQVSDENFKDLDGKWFIRGYDQALMLPLLHVSKNRKFISDVCYVYNINSVSVEDRTWVERDQMFTINLVRARGFIS